MGYERIRIGMVTGDGMGWDAGVEEVGVLSELDRI